MIKPNKSILVFVILIISTTLIYADGWTSSNPSHQTLYADTITSKTDASSVNIADSQGLFVTGDITSLGKVGIGTTSPIANRQLHIVASGGPILRLERSGFTGILELETDGTTPAVLTRGNAPLAFRITDTEAMRITTLGNVGIGTTGPTALTHVLNSGTGNEGRTVLRAQGMSGQTADILLVENSVGTDLFRISNIGSLVMDAAPFIVTNSGNVGIGTTNPSSALDVGGTSSGAVRIDGRGAFFLAAEAACLATGSGDRFLVWSAGTSQNCNQACSAIVCGAAASCVQGWTVWSGTTHYRYGPECTSPDPSGGQGISGKLCCCTGTGCAQNMYR